MITYNEWRVSSVNQGLIVSLGFRFQFFTNVINVTWSFFKISGGKKHSKIACKHGHMRCKPFKSFMSVL